MLKIVIYYSIKRYQEKYFFYKIYNKIFKYEPKDKKASDEKASEEKASDEKTKGEDQP